jgi:hypothetical protein
MSISINTIDIISRSIPKMTNQILINADINELY